MGKLPRQHKIFFKAAKEYQKNTMKGSVAEKEDFASIPKEINYEDEAGGQHRGGAFVDPKFCKLRGCWFLASLPKQMEEHVELMHNL